LSIRARMPSHGHSAILVLFCNRRGTASEEDARMDHDIKWVAEHPHLKGGDYFGAAHGQK
jgi:hypothetical protein